RRSSDLFLADYLRLACDQKLYSNCKIKRNFNLFTALLAIQSLHFLYLYLFKARSSISIIFHYDLVQIANLPPETNFVLISIMGLAGYFFYLLYIEDYWDVHRILYDQVIFVKSTYFFSPFFK